MNAVSPAFAAALADRRDSLNERFALRRRAGAKIEPAAFVAHLQGAVGPLVELVHAKYSERTPAVLTALYDASLDLFAASLLGPEAKFPTIQRVWTELLPNAVALLAREPVALVGCLCNATFQIAGQRGANPDLWLDRMRSALPHCSSLVEAVDAGSVAAWQAGMPQYRGPAIAAAERLKPAPAAAALGITAEILRETVASLKADRWFRIGTSAAEVALVPVGQAGAFTGFGGPFSHPPKVSCSDGQLVATTDGISWRMIADGYGAWFQRMAATRTKPTPLPKDVSVDARGTVRWGKLTFAAPHLVEPSSIACDGETLAITIPTSHRIFLFARTARRE